MQNSSKPLSGADRVRGSLHAAVQQWRLQQGMGSQHARPARTSAAHSTYFGPEYLLLKGIEHSHGCQTPGWRSPQSQWHRHIRRAADMGSRTTEARWWQFTGCTEAMEPYSHPDNTTKQSGAGDSAPKGRHGRHGSSLAAVPSSRGALASAFANHTAHDASVNHHAARGIHRRPQRARPFDLRGVAGRHGLVEIDSLPPPQSPRCGCGKSAHPRLLACQEINA